MQLIWSQDGKTLYLRRVFAVMNAPRTPGRAEIVVWREGGKATVLSGLAFASSQLDFALLPDGDPLLRNGKGLWSIRPDGELRALPSDVTHALAGSHLLGLDDQGRAILLKRENDDCSYIATADLTTGQLTRIYP